MIVKTDGSFAALINATDRTHVLVPPQPRPGHRGEPRHRGLQLPQPGQRVQVEVTVLRQEVISLEVRSKKLCNVFQDVFTMLL